MYFTHSFANIQIYIISVLKADSCVRGNEFPVSVKGGEILE